jgi:hypothetical protein
MAGDGPVFSKELCDLGLPDLVDECVAEDGALVSAGSKQTVDDCVAAYENFACSELCDQVPQDPVACQSLTDDRNTDFVSCQ